jgi:hypothetical protein
MKIYDIWREEVKVTAINFLDLLLNITNIVTRGGIDNGF